VRFTRDDAVRLSSETAAAIGGSERRGPRASAAMSLACWRPDARKLSSGKDLEM
jgi:hypothetical protein